MKICSSEQFFFYPFIIAALTPSTRLTAVGSSYHKAAAQWQSVRSSENAKGKICKISREYKAQDVLGKPSIWTPTRYRGLYLTEGRWEVLIFSRRACICHYAACVVWVCCWEQAGVSMVWVVPSASVSIA